jgi:group I intron endonuclease
MRTGCVYKFTNKVNGKVYIGKTIDFKRRKKEHRRSAKNPKHYFGRALRKHGFDNFEIEILIDNISEDKMNELETEFIQVHKSNNRKFGYNQTLGGEGKFGWICSEKTKEAIRKANTKNHTVEGGGCIIFNKQFNKFQVIGKHPEKKSVGLYLTKEKSEEALDLYNTTGERMSSDIVRRRNGTGNIRKRKNGRFRARCKGKNIGTFDTEAEAKEALEKYGESNNTTNTCT